MQDDRNARIDLDGPNENEDAITSQFLWSGNKVYDWQEYRLSSGSATVDFSYSPYYKRD